MVKEISVGDRKYRLVAFERGAEWIAHAERAETGDRFGIECSGRTEADAARAREAEAADRVRRRAARKGEAGEEAVGS